jgi:hypothetical protein
MRSLLLSGRRAPEKCGRYSRGSVVLGARPRAYGILPAPRSIVPKAGGRLGGLLVEEVVIVAPDGTEHSDGQREMLDDRTRFQSLRLATLSQLAGKSPERMRLHRGWIGVRRQRFRPAEMSAPMKFTTSAAKVWPRKMGDFTAN